MSGTSSVARMFHSAVTPVAAVARVRSIPSSASIAYCVGSTIAPPPGMPLLIMNDVLAIPSAARNFSSGRTAFHWVA